MLLIGYRGKLFVLLCGGRGLCLFIKVAKLLSQLMPHLSVKIDIHQGPTLNPLLFIMVMDVLTEDVRDGSLMELLYAVYLVLCGESLSEIMDKCMGDGEILWMERVKG